MIQKRIKLRLKKLKKFASAMAKPNYTPVAHHFRGKVGGKIDRGSIPFQIRQTAWPRIIGNIVKVTPKMYEITVSHAKKLNDMTDDSEIEKTENASLKLISADLARTFPSLDLFGEGGVWTAIKRMSGGFCFTPS